MPEQNNGNDWLNENVEEARSVTWIETKTPKLFNEKDSSSDHSHCIICWKAISRETTPIIYESSIGWVCVECYEKHLGV